MGKLREQSYTDIPLRHEQRVYREDMRCGKCRRGKMRPTGKPAVNDKTPHACNFCQREESFPGEPFPRMVEEWVQC